MKEKERDEYIGLMIYTLLGFDTGVDPKELIKKLDE